MSTTPTPSPSTSFWTTLQNLLPAIELAGNTAALLIPGGATFEPLIAGLEQAVTPLIQAIGTKQTTSNVVMTVYGTIIGILTTLKAQPGLPTAELATITAYITAAENGTAAYTQATSGYNPANYAPVTPIS